METETSIKPLYMKHDVAQAGRYLWIEPRDDGVHLQIRQRNYYRDASDIVAEIVLHPQDALTFGKYLLETWEWTPLLDSTNLPAEYPSRTNAISKPGERADGA